MMTNKHLSRLALGTGGIAFFDVTATYFAGNIEGFEVVGNTVVDYLEVDGESVLAAANIESPYNFAGKTMAATWPIIRPPLGKVFTKLKFSTNGGVIIYLGR